MKTREKLLAEKSANNNLEIASTPLEKKVKKYKINPLEG